MQMADRRRSTAQPAADPYGNGRSGIPVHIPGTVRKPGPNRMSLAGPALRAPYQTPGPASNLRQSMNPLLQTISKPNYGRTPLSQSVRRGSVWVGGAALGQPSGSQTMKDPRPLRDKSYQAKMKHDIYNFLQSAGFDIAKESLSNIQGKEYRVIVEFLVHVLDPNYSFNPNIRFEEEFVPAMKCLKYPFSHQIDNKWLAAPASMHSWPPLLGVLHWLVELCKLREHYMNSGHPTLQTPEQVPEEFNDPHDHHALIFDYYDRAYTIWLNLIDDLSEANHYLEDRYARKNERVQNDLAEITKRYEEAKGVHERMRSSTAPIDKLENENKLLKADSEKFQKILQQYEGRKKKLIDTIAYENAELATGEANLGQLRQELLKLQDIVKTQNLTPEEVARMASDHETLSRNLEDLRQKSTETHRTVMNLEVAVTHRAEAAEEALDSYMNYLSSLELFPPLPPPFADVDLSLELNTGASNPQLLLTGPDVRKIVKPTLNGIAEANRSQRAAVESEKDRIEDELDQRTVECENVEERIDALEKKVFALNVQADDYRDAAQQEAAVASAEAARLERETANARTAALASGTGVKTRLQALQFDYRERVERLSRLKEDTVRAIIKNSHDIAIFKEEVSRHLRELKEFAESENWRI